jgi:hypothetical protein
VRRFTVRLVTIALLAVVAVAAVAMRVGAQQAAAITSGQRAFGERFVEAVDANDSAKMRALIPPATLKCFDDAGKQKILDDWIAEQFNYQIPKDHQISVSPIPPDMVKPSKMESYPVPRTHLMEFQYADGASVVTVSQEIGKQGGNWYAIPPCPTAARMAMLAKKEKQKAERRALAERTYAELRPELKSQLRALIANRDNARARKVCMDTLHVDYRTASAVVARVAAEKRD